MEETTGSGDQKRWSPRILAEVVGTREQALAKLTALVHSFVPKYPRLPGRRVLLRDGDTYMLVARGWSDDFHCVFRVWEVLSDTERPETVEVDRSARE